MIKRFPSVTYLFICLFAVTIAFLFFPSCADDGSNIVGTPSVTMTSDTIRLNTLEGGSISYQNFELHILPYTIPFKSNGSPGEVTFKIEVGVIPPIPIDVTLGNLLPGSQFIKITPDNAFLNHPVHIKFPAINESNPEGLCILHYYEDSSKWKRVPLSEFDSKKKIGIDVLKLGYFVLVYSNNIIDNDSKNIKSDINERKSYSKDKDFNIANLPSQGGIKFDITDNTYWYTLTIKSAILADNTQHNWYINNLVGQVFSSTPSGISNTSSNAVYAVLPQGVYRFYVSRKKYNEALTTNSFDVLVQVTNPLQYSWAGNTGWQTLGNPQGNWETGKPPNWPPSTFGNNIPNTPNNPFPQDGQIIQSDSITISWAGGDPDPGDIVKYDLYFGTNNPPPLFTSNISNTNYKIIGLTTSSIYYWRIIAKDMFNATTTGPVWSFSTPQITTNIYSGFSVIPTNKQFVSGNFFVKDNNHNPIIGLQSSNITATLSSSNNSCIGNVTVAANLGTGKNVAGAITMDYSGSMGSSQIQCMEDGVKTYINAMGSNDQSEIIKFDDMVIVAQPFTNNKTLLINAVDSNFSLGGSTALYQSIYKGTTDFFPINSNQFVKSVIALTDGGENASSISRATMINTALINATPVNSIFLYSDTANSLAKDMRNIADTTGGFFFWAKPDGSCSSSLNNFYEKIHSILLNSYSISVEWPCGNSIPSGTLCNITFKITYNNMISYYKRSYLMP